MLGLMDNWPNLIERRALLTAQFALLTEYKTPTFSQKNITFPAKESHIGTHK